MLSPLFPYPQPLPMHTHIGLVTWSTNSTGLQLEGIELNPARAEPVDSIAHAEHLLLGMAASGKAPRSNIFGTLISSTRSISSRTRIRPANTIMASQHVMELLVEQPEFSPCSSIHYGSWRNRGVIAGMVAWEHLGNGPLQEDELLVALVQPGDLICAPGVLAHHDNTLMLCGISGQNQNRGLGQTNDFMLRWQLV